MKQVSLSIMLLTCGTQALGSSMDSKPQPTQSAIDAGQTIASAWARFSTSWANEDTALATSRAITFSSDTGLQASVTYAENPSTPQQVNAAPYRLGLTGLLIGKNQIPCYVANPADPIPDITKDIATSYLGKKVLYQTIWHFLGSKKGKRVVQDYIDLHKSN